MKWLQESLQSFVSFCYDSSWCCGRCLGRGGLNTDRGAEMTDRGRFMSARWQGCVPKASVVACLAALPLAGCATVPPVAPVPKLVAAGNGDSAAPDIAAGNRYVSFASTSTDLVVEPDPNGAGADYFLADTVAGTIQRITTSATGASGTGGTSLPFTTSISEDGRYVAFASAAPDLSAEVDTDENVDIYRWDRVTGTTIRVSDGVNSALWQFLDISDSGDVIGWVERTPTRQIMTAKISTAALHATPIADQTHDVTGVEVAGNGSAVLYSTSNQIFERGEIVSIHPDTFATQTVLGGADGFYRAISGVSTDGTVILYRKSQPSTQTSLAIRRDLASGTETTLGTDSRGAALEGYARFSLHIVQTSTASSQIGRIVWTDAQGGTSIVAEYLANPTVSGSNFSDFMGLATDGTLAFATKLPAGTNRSAVYTFHP